MVPFVKSISGTATTVGISSMPVVPINRASPTPSPVALPDEKYLMMAAAQMHKEGRLVQNDSMPEIPPAKKEELRQMLDRIKATGHKSTNRIAPPPSNLRKNTGPPPVNVTAQR